MIFLQLFASFKGFVALVLGTILGILVTSAVIVVSSLLTAKLTGAWISQIRIFGKTGKKGRTDENREWHKDKFVLLPVVILNATMEGDFREDLKKMNIVNAILTFAMAGIYAFVGIFLTWKNTAFVASMFKYSAIFAVIEIVLSCLKMIVSKIKKGNSLGNFCLDRFEELKNGLSLEQLNMSVPDTMLDKADQHSKIFYYHMCYTKSLWMRNFNALNGIVRQLDLALRKHGPNSDYIETTLDVYGYYDILFYSSYVNQNHNHAIRIYNLIKPKLDADKDANGRRVKAYYEFYVLNQSQQASITLNQAIEALRDVDTVVTTKAEIDLERRLIEELQDNMTRIMNPGGFGHPVIENTFDDEPLL